MVLAIGWLLLRLDILKCHRKSYFQNMETDGIDEILMDSAQKNFSSRSVYMGTRKKVKVESTKAVKLMYRCYGALNPVGTLSFRSKVCHSLILRSKATTSE